MSVQDFRQCLSLTLAYEGGYVNNPNDPGGPTNQGITQKVYDAYRELYGRPKQSVRFITSDEVADIYKKQYWLAVKGDDLPAGLDYCVFDFAVNSGISRAIKYLQKTLGVPTNEIDGNLGTITLSMTYAEIKRDNTDLIVKYCANRLAYLKSLNTFSIFGKGWTRRVIGSKDGAQEDDNGVIDYAVKMALKVPDYTMPTEIGKKSDEVAGKSYSPSNYPVIMATKDDLALVMAANDLLAKRI